MDKIGLEAVLNDRNFQAGLQRYMAGLAKMERETARAAGATMRSFAGSAMKIGAAITGIGAAAAAGGVILAVRALSQELSALIQRGAEIEGVRSAFWATQGDMQTVLEAYREAAAGMVADTELMKNYNLAAMLVSKTFADELPSAMQYLRKVSAATGQSMSYLLDSLIRGVGRLSPLILDNLAVQIDMTAAQEKYAATLGKSADELSKAEQQTAVFNEVMRQLKRNTADLPDVVGRTMQLWAQFQTTLQNVRDEIAMRLAPYINDIAMQVLPQLGDAISVLGEGFGQFISAWAPVLARSLQTITTDVGILIQAWGDLREETGKPVTAEPLEGVAEKLIGMSEEVLTLVENFRHGREVIAIYIGTLAAQIHIRVEAIKKSLSSIADAVEGVIVAFGALTLAIQGRMEEAKQTWQAAKDIFAGIEWSQVIPTNEEQLRQANAALAEMRRMLAEEGALHNENLMRIRRQTTELEKQVDVLRGRRTMLERLTAGQPPIPDWLDEMRRVGAIPMPENEVEVPVAPKLDPGAKKTFESAWNAMVSRARGYLESAISESKGLFDFVPDIFKPGANGPFENIFRAQAVAVGGDENEWAQVLGLDQETARRIVEKFQRGIIDEEVRALIDMPALVEEAQMAALAESMKEAFAKEVASRAGVGTDVVTSLLGMKDPALPGRINENVKTIASQAVVAIGAEEVAMESAGKSFMSALIRGLESMREDVLLTIDDIARAMVATMRSVLEGGAAPPSGGNYTPPPPTGRGAGQTFNSRVFNVQVNVPAGAAAGVRQAATDGVLAAFKAVGVA